MRDLFNEMVKTMDAVKAYSYHIIGDNTIFDDNSQKKFNYAVIYKVDKRNQKASMIIDNKVEDTKDHLEIYFFDNAMYSRSSLKPEWQVKKYSPENFKKLFLPTGYLDLFNFSLWDTNNMEIQALRGDILISKIALKAVKIPSINFTLSNNLDSTKHILVNPATQILEFAKCAVNMSHRTSTSTVNIAGTHSCTKLGIDDEVMVDIPLF